MSDPKAAIADYVQTHPGIHFNELVRSLDLARGQVQYHLRRLQSEDTVITERRYGRMHYYPPSTDDWERRALALLRRETAGDIVVYLLAHGPARPATVTSELDIARSTLVWHVDHLVDDEIITKDQDDSGRMMLRIRRPDDTIRLLREVDPSLRERFIARFTRLADSLLSE